MCGRFTLTINPADLQDAFSGYFNVPSDVHPYLQPRYNIAPSNRVAVVTNSGNKRLELFRWGLIPSWASLPKKSSSNEIVSEAGINSANIPDIGNRLINARSETLDQKPSFRTAYRKQRCLILADGFYEWSFNEQKNRKIPYFFYLKESNPETQQPRRPFAFAGLWDRWVRRVDGVEFYTCTIITTTPNDVIAPFHGRMPVILPPESYDEWLSPTERRMKSDEDKLLIPYTASKMAQHPVSWHVNNTTNDDESCIKEYDIS